MKRIACVFIELDDNETVEDVMAKLSQPNTEVKSEPEGLLEVELDWREKLKKILTDLGENISNLGFSTMLDIMECVEKTPEYKEYFQAKELYAYVTEKTGRPYAQIERNIRAMLERIYSKNSSDRICDILGVQAVALAESYGKVSNTDFFAIIIDKIF